MKYHETRIANASPMNKTRAVGLLQEMHRLLQVGWCRKAFEVKRGEKVHYCMLGAMQAASNDVVAYDIARSALQVGVGHNTDLVAWNDEQKSKGPVLAAVKQAIKRLDPSADVPT